MFNNKTILKSQLRFKCDRHNVYTEEVNKTALNSSDNKRLKTFDGVTTYPYGTSALKYVKEKLWSKKKDMPIKLYYNKK